MTITAALENQVVENVPKGALIGGNWVENGKTLEVIDPSTGEALCEITDAGETEALAALDAAASAQEAWAKTAPRDRGEILRAVYESMMARQDELALLMTLEMGKPVSESKAEIAYAADFFRWFSEEAVRIAGRYSTMTNGVGRILTMKQPIGPCVFVTPWNFPAAMGTRKIGPALAAGCTVVMKPAKETPLSSFALAQALIDAGLPDGVVNVVVGSSASQIVGPLLKDPRTRKLSFTGSTEVGRELIKQSADNVLKVSMELGGNAPFIVHEDADLDAAVEGAILAKMRNNGEACTAANRFHAHESIAQQFSEKLAERLGAMKVGRGTLEDSQVGPLINEAQREIVEGLVEDATAKGGKLLTGGERPDGPGYYFPPTVIGDLTPDANILVDEVFGPVAPVKSFSTEEEALASANATEYGLAAYVYTRDLGRAFRTIEGLETGMVGLNRGVISNPAAPFGGIKQSGFGREGGFEGIEEYLDTKYVGMDF
ncbi:MAG: NAD-dependent succinate-semialdehyde dehydrogenase [Solirubrobacterales bacterium]